MKSTTRRLLIQLGLSPKYKGYDAIVEAVDLFAKEPDIKTTAIYASVAKTLGSTYNKVERNIRKSILVILDRGNDKLLHKICGYNVLKEGHIVNSDFIACLAYYVLEVYNNG